MLQTQWDSIINKFSPLVIPSRRTGTQSTGYKKLAVVTKFSVCFFSKIFSQLINENNQYIGVYWHAIARSHTDFRPMISTMSCFLVR